ncbi:murein DD-endopeptidase MepM/ murein hydrolase activator NlpD [Marisediminicola sp. UYEF4]|uniref:M23 family metallopeptidase n=1 Tax=Marisediminicola sp. UYEF4 TaxID=1756384 RepID=UPI003391F909
MRSFDSLLGTQTPAETPNTTAQASPDTDAVSSLAAQFTTATSPIVPDASAEAPALTRRELRERDAKAARPKLFAATAPPRANPKRSESARARTGRSARRHAPTSRVVPAATPAPTRASASLAAKTSHLKRRLLSNLATVGAMAGVGLILISTTVPANAFARPESSVNATAVTESTAKTQELKVEAAAAPEITRDGYTVVSLVRQVQARAGSRSYNFTNNPTSAIQWPFPGGSPITSGFGPRQVAGCGFCSTYHQGLDFTPGAVPIQAIAGGVVSTVQVSDSGFGNYVVVDHIVNGQKVQSAYAHMQYGSIQVAVGQTIGVGDMIGVVGNSGASTGVHLHLELRLGGAAVDPFAWLQANAG